MKELISIIVPVYNVEKYLERCLISLLNQTYSNLEIILVNDGSTDDSGKICDKYELIDNRIKVIHKENGGLSSARNIGFTASEGRYIGFIDSDDWISDDMFQYLYSILVDNDADMSISSYIRCGSIEEGYSLASKKNDNNITVYSQDEYMKKFMKIDSQTIEYYAWNKLYKRELLSEKQYPEGFTAEDVLGTFKALLHAKKIVQSNRITYFYYINPNSITADFNIKKAYDLLGVWDLVVALSQSNDVYHNWAILNRNRVDFTVLFQIAISKNFKQLIEDYDFITDLNHRLIDNKKRLLEMNMSISRKIIIRMFCWNYSLSSSLLNFINNKLRFLK